MKTRFRTILLSLFSLLAILLTCATARVEGVWPIGISFSPEHHVPEGVIGLALGLPWGEYEAVAGIEASLAVNKTKHWMVGFQMTPGVNMADQTLLAWQAACIANYAEDAFGIQTAIAYNRINDSLSGMQFGAANFAGELKHGLQIGIFNRAGPPGAFDRVQNGIQFGVVNWSDNISGTQLGLWNRAPDIHGLQLGLVNTATTLHGLQLGLLNFVSESTLPCLPLLRVSF
ncbi:MAG: hypothetical protein IKQ55_11870 [Kiritimatiellae bacterium]|nr:hypothetical protein [Kiritimatiellia bacterium]